MLISQLNTEKFLYGIQLEAPDGSPSGLGIAGNSRIKIINLGPVVNTEYEDYAPTVTADGKIIYFVSNRMGSKKLPNGKLSTDFWAIKKSNSTDTVYNTSSYNIDESVDNDQLGINTVLNEGVATISADGKTLYFTGCNRPDGFGDCDIYKVTLSGETWGKPMNLGKNVNSEYFDSQPSITSDQSRLYFVSTRPGKNSSGRNKHEEMDIWYCDWDNDLDEWKSAKNLETVNTKGKDCSPFICADGKTLVFSSDGHSPNYGGLDFYYSEYSPSSKIWSAPVNMGEPLNTKGDEQFFTMTAAGDVMYFSSTRSDIPNYQGGLDLFMGIVPTYPRTILVKGIVVDECTGDLIPATVTVRNSATNTIDSSILDSKKTNFEYIVTYNDFKNADSVELEITSSNPRFGAKTIRQKVKQPKITEDPNTAAKHADSIVITIPMGERPSLVPRVAEAEYIKKAKLTDKKLANFNGLVMEEILNWNLYPLLTYVFFEAGSSEIPSRYIRFKSNNDARLFSDTTITGGTLSKYYHILNIFGFRLQKHPNVNIEIVGCNDAGTAAEKREGLSKERADNVYNYLRDIWNISPDRMKLTYRNLPKTPSNPRDSLGIIENRRVELVCDEWEVFKPVFDKDIATVPQPEEMVFSMKNGIDNNIVASRKIVIKRGDKEWITLEKIGTTDTAYTWDWTNDNGEYPTDNQAYTAQLIVTTKSGAVCTSDPVDIPTHQVSTEERMIATGEGKTKENYSLILFPFNSAEAGPVNERVMRDYVYDRVMPSSDVEVIGHTDIVGLFDHNVKLSERRATTVKNGIQRQSGGKYKNLAVRGVGPEEPLYPNNIPEGRFYNRTVQVLIESTITSATK